MLCTYGVGIQGVSDEKIEQLGNGLEFEAAFTF